MTRYRITVTREPGPSSTHELTARSEPDARARALNIARTDDLMYRRYTHENLTYRVANCEEILD